MTTAEVNRIASAGVEASLQNQVARLQSMLSRLRQVDKRFTLARLLTFLAGALCVIVLLILQLDTPALVALVFFFLIFLIIVYFHRRLDRSRQRFQAALSWVSTQLARLNLNWEPLPAPIQVTLDIHHPFAIDLNLIGDRSLHQLIDTAASWGGSQRLAAWLLEPIPNLDAIRDRHAILRELIPLSGFRGRLAMKGLQIQSESQGQWDAEKLLHWLEASIPPRSFALALAVLTFLAVLNLLLLALNLLGYLSAYWIVTLGLYMFLYLGQYSRYRDLFADTYLIGRSLQQLKAILEFLETASYTSTPHLARLCRPFTDPVQRPSRYLRQITWITLAAGLGNNQVLSMIFNAILPWNLWSAFILEGFKKNLRAPLQTWLDTWYTFEALCSLANFSWLHPNYAFPEFISSELQPGQPAFQAACLGHPLIPPIRRVCNDFSLQSLGSVVILTGSNMSGKSTFLRTIGINLCLANAGSPVVASDFKIQPFRLFTCIQVTDSLADGISYFYAEVHRLKQLLSELQSSSPYPLFFLIDEIYRGTNNRERRIGSHAYIRALSHSQGVGLISTHDLDLVQSTSLERNVLNYHFKEEIRDDRMVYDYHLRPGPSPTTNALKIMEIEGLPVDGGE